MEGLRGRGRDDSRIFWSELKVERKKKKKSKSTEQNEDDKAAVSAPWLQSADSGADFSNLALAL